MELIVRSFFISEKAFSFASDESLVFSIRVLVGVHNAVKGDVGRVLFIEFDFNQKITTKTINYSGSFHSSNCSRFL
jgi:hypothetical protein